MIQVKFGGHYIQDPVLIINLKEKLKSLNIMYQDFGVLLEQLSSVIDNEEFIPDYLKDSVHNLLLSISKIQSEFMQEYNTLEIGNPDNRIPEVIETLDVQLACLSEKNEFKKTIDYVNGLHSMDSDVSVALQREKESVSSFDLEEASIEKCKESLGKYSILRQAVEETDPKKRFDLAFSSLLGLFEKDILFGITNGAVYFKADETGNGNSEEPVVVTDVQDNMPPKIVPEEESISDNKSHDDSFEQNVHEKEDSSNEEVPKGNLTPENHPDLQEKTVMILPNGMS